MKMVAALFACLVAIAGCVSSTPQTKLSQVLNRPDRGTGEFVVQVDRECQFGVTICDESGCFPLGSADEPGTTFRRPLSELPSKVGRQAKLSVYGPDNPKLVKWWVQR